MASINVIMGVYNCQDTLSGAIRSILQQTYKDWELIICDDGSQDNTYAVAIKFEKQFPEKIHVIRNEKNLGLNKTLNRCLEIANGLYIARMDGDDICAPDRFSEEVKVLENEPDIAIVSTDMSYFDEAGVWGLIKHDTYPEKTAFLYETPFCHAPCMVRREAFEAVGGYTESEKLLRVEDYNLWMKMYKKGLKGKNIHKTLYSMRDDRDAYNRRKFKYRINQTYAIGLAVKELQLPLWGYILALRPIVVGILPSKVYDKLHRWKLKRE